ncbi:MAG TPA: hypothetical protein VGD25_03295, partial [Immundisolibacter sp.]
MNIIRAVKTLPRQVDEALAARLRVMPAVVLTGARQTGKSTVVEKLIPGERRYRSLDDFAAKVPTLRQRLLQPTLIGTRLTALA